MTTPADINALADSVNDEQDFIRFLFTLAEDWEAEQTLEMVSPSLGYGPGALGWENGTVGAVFESAAAWGESTIDGTKFYEKPGNPWRRAAQILSAGKFYE